MTLVSLGKATFLNCFVSLYILTFISVSQLSTYRSSDHLLFYFFLILIWTFANYWLWLCNKILSIKGLHWTSRCFVLVSARLNMGWTGLPVTWQLPATPATVISPIHCIEAFKRRTTLTNVRYPQDATSSGSKSTEIVFKVLHAFCFLALPYLLKSLPLLTSPPDTP